MDTLADLLARGREREGAAVDAPGRTAPYSYREFCTNAWKAGNLLRHYGVRPDARVALVVGPKEPDAGTEVGTLGDAVDPLLAFFGGAALGATVDVTPWTPVDARALVVPDAWLDRYEVAPGCSRLAYGGPPEVPGVAHFERELWSENPTEPPDSVATGDGVLRAGGVEYTHGELLTAAGDVARTHGLEAGGRVGLDAPLTSAGAMAAGVVAPLLVGATVRPCVGGDDDRERRLSYVVRAERDGNGDRGEGVVDPATVIG